MGRARTNRQANPFLLLLCSALAASAIAAAAQSPSGSSKSSSQPPDPLAGVLDHMYNLEFVPARQELERWVATHPDDLRGWNYLAESILDEEMLREGMLATGAYVEHGDAFRKRQAPLQQKFEAEFFAPLDKAQSLGEARLRRNPRDQEALYWTGVEHGTRAEFYFALLRKYITAAHEGVEARRYELRLSQVNPSDADPMLIIGIADYATGSLPWYEKIVLSVAGVHGNRPRGVAEMQRASREGHWAREDAKFVLIAVYRREKMFSQLLSDLDELSRAYPRNYLVDFEEARAYKDQDRWRDAANVYDRLVARLDAQGPGDPLPAARLLYLDGQAYQHLGDPGQALKLYEQACRLPGDSLDTYRASLAAGKLEEGKGQLAEAKQSYERVIKAIPDTEEGKTARLALKNLN